MKNKLTQQRLKKLLYYNPSTGVFTWKNDKGNNMKEGSIAGTVCLIKEYRTICVDKKLYRAGRLAWLYMEGYLPENQTDHKNRIRNDDRFCNLRHVSNLCNARNSKVKKTNMSGIKGVYQNKGCCSWIAEIFVLGQKFYLGSFASKKSAAQARWEAEVEHGYPNCNTTSSAYQYLQASLY